MVSTEQHRQKSGDHRLSNGIGGISTSHEQGGLRADDEAMSLTPIDPAQVIKFGSTKFSDYTKV